MRIKASRFAEVVPVAVMFGLVLGACERRPSEERAEEPGGPAAEEQPVPAAPGAAALTDANIAALIDEVNIADSTAASVALPKLRDPDVKRFAEQIMADHHQLHVRSLEIARAQNITPQPPVSNPFQAAVAAERAVLDTMPAGPAYDSTYIAHEVTIHQAAVDWARRPENQPTNEAYRQFLQSQALPVLERHLNRALELQRKLAGSRQQ